jgi:hypothetical protein
LAAQSLPSTIPCTRWLGWICCLKTEMLEYAENAASNAFCPSHGAAEAWALGRIYGIQPALVGNTNENVRVSKKFDCHGLKCSAGSCSGRPWCTSSGVSPTRGSKNPDSSTIIQLYITQASIPLYPLRSSRMTFPLPLSSASRQQNC